MITADMQQLGGGQQTQLQQRHTNGEGCSSWQNCCEHDGEFTYPESDQLDQPTNDRLKSRMKTPNSRRE